MSKLNRRECIEGVLAALAATALPSAAKGAPARAAKDNSATEDEKFKICLVWGIDDPHRVKLSKQIGVTHAIAGTATELSRVPRARHVDTVAKIKAEYEAAG